jgi:hypothetical protein
MKTEAGMRRRYFFRALFGAAAVAGLPVVHDPADLYTDPYQDFLNRVRTRLLSLTREHGRPITKMWIDPPRVSDCGRHYIRTTHVRLEIGGTLLDTNYLEFDEVSGTRCLWEDF